MKVKKVLVYRLGSLGDTIVALPCFHLIARVFPSARRYLLTNFLSDTRASHASAILGGSGLVHDYISYPAGLRDPLQLIELYHQIRRLAPDILIYLTEPRGRLKIFRDAFFFKVCGIKKLIGVPYQEKLFSNQWLPDQQCYEYEAKRLARCLSNLGDARLDDPDNWSLCLSEAEKNRVKKILLDAGLRPPFIACCVGAKVEVKNWGLINWKNLIAKLYLRFNDYTLMLIGAANEFALAEEASANWHGYKINFCGRLSPRESAAALQYADIFIGHDSGPMHLAAAMGVPCVAIFSARNKPKVWFPYGKRHKVIYHRTECWGCGLDVCQEHGKKCIMSISPDEVMQNVLKILQ